MASIGGFGVLLMILTRYRGRQDHEHEVSRVLENPVSGKKEAAGKEPAWSGGH